MGRIVTVKTFLTTLLLCASAIFASGQAVDIRLGSIGPYNDLVRGATWGSTGVGNSDNSYIFPPTNPQEQTCVYMSNNNPTSSHTFTITFRYSGDPKVTGYLSNNGTQEGRWKNVQVISDTILAGSTNNYSFSSPGAAWAQVQISGSSTQTGSPDTVDIYIVQTATNCGTGTININAPASCANSASLSVPSTSTEVIVAAPAAGQYVHICAISLTFSAAITGAQAVSLVHGSGGAFGSPCTPNSSAEWLIEEAVNTTPFPYTIGSGQAQLFQSLTPASAMCVENGTAGANAVVSISYYIG
jgi:hypothetical protein